MKLEYSKGHIMALDGLRGIAIILVLLYHLFDFAPFENFTKFGWIGVDIFFVLSGFLITGIILDNKHIDKYYKLFLLRRSLRILPLYFLILLLIFVIYGLLTLDNSEILLNNQIYYLTFTFNLLVAFNGWPQEFSGLNHFWSLAIEIQFYLIWPILVLKLRKKCLLAIASLLIITAIVSRNLSSNLIFSYVFTLTRIDGLLIGSIAAVLIRENIQLLQKYIVEISIVTIFSFLALIFFYRDTWFFSSPTFLHFDYTLLVISICSILLTSFGQSHIGKGINKVLVIRLFTYFGKYSYGLYVYHYILNYLFSDFIVLQLLGFSQISQKFISATLIIVLSMITSYISFHAYEKKFIVLKRNHTEV